MAQVHGNKEDFRSEILAALLTRYNLLIASTMTTEVHGYVQALTTNAAPTTAEEARAICAQLYYQWDSHAKKTIVHLNADSTNLLSGDAAVNPLTRDLAIPWATAWKVIFNAHLIQGTRHYQNDATNTITAADADLPGTLPHDGLCAVVATPDSSSLETQVALCRAMWTAYGTTHIADTNAHENADTANVLTVSIPSTYLGTAHRAFSAAVATADASDMDTAKALANALRTSYHTGGHINGASIHKADDATNTISAAASTGAGETCHDGQTTNVATTAPTNYATCKTILNTILKPAFNLHMLDTAAHQAADAVNTIVSPDATTDGSADTLANEIKVALKAGGHLNEAGIHWHDDVTTTIAAADSTTEGTCVTLVTELLLKLNSHMNYSSERSIVLLANDIRTKVIAHATQTGVHDVADAVLAAFATGASTTLTTAKTLLNALKPALNAHYIKSNVYENCLASNQIKSKYNTHRGQLLVHYVNDASHDVTSADATDQASCQTLINEIKGDYNDHVNVSIDKVFITLVTDERAMFLAHLALAFTGADMLELVQ